MKNATKNNTVELKQQIIMNTRQKVGCDTPRRKPQKIELKHIPEEKKEIIEDEKPARSMKRSDSVRSVDFREEVVTEKTKTIKLKNPAKKNKVPKYKSPQKEGKLKIMEEEHEVILNTGNDVENSNRHESNPNIKSEDTIDRDKNEPPLLKNTKAMISTLNRIIFNRVKKGLFLKYKEDVMVKELEEIKIYHIKPNSKVEVLILKEKLNNKENEKKEIISNLVVFDQNMNNNLSDIRISPKNLITKKIEVNKKNTNDLNEGVLDLNNNKNDLKIKPFDLLNIRKQATNERNTRGREPNTSNNQNNNLQEAIRKKFDEINEKLKNYENLAQNLGKEFHKHYNK